MCSSLRTECRGLEYETNNSPTRRCLEDRLRVQTCMNTRQGAIQEAQPEPWHDDDASSLSRLAAQQRLIVLLVVITDNTTLARDP
mmetsp:Transcript_12044/g.21730  ORF Transcript_12044/g.21730 Transcript_12044/m.21730 type:complete len:85 (+) Transcript_12044:264-518(+)